MGKLVLGVGVNDADYTVSFQREGKTIMCDFYTRWFCMLKRCYDVNFQNRRPSYFGCTVCDEWLTFSNFKKWMETQDWQGKELDKDILFQGNKVYSPESCVFVDRVTNSFFNDRGALRGGYLIGVSFNSKNKTYQSRCRNPFTKEAEYLGMFKTELSAHLAWRKRKHELACQLAELQLDPKTAEAIRVRYL